ncbi:MAG: hypothetical protein IH867_07120 [Chloroflexi bacterium]|nr:hypothetical protein [Chloroflexota bacterium]
MGIRKSANSLVAIALAVLIVGTVAGCSSSSDDSQSGSTSPISPGSIFTVADVEAAGWKRSKQLESENLDRAQEAWYGFFNQEDIELWIYASSDDAMNFGAPAAQSILDEGRGVDILNSIRGGTSVYSAYLVVGNVLMFCESADGSCDVLAEQLN